MFQFTILIFISLADDFHSIGFDYNIFLYLL